MSYNPGETDDEYIERISELKQEIALALDAVGANAWPLKAESDVWVEGWLTDIAEVVREMRNEIEELGD